MSRVCQVTGKRPVTGNNVSHAKNRTRRRFLPNLHHHRFWVESEKRFVSLRVSSKGMRIIDKLGAVVRVVADDERSQVRNRALAAERLGSKLRGALHVQRGRRATKPTRGSQRRRLKAKSERSEVKQQRRRPTQDE